MDMKHKSAEEPVGRYGDCEKLLIECHADRRTFLCFCKFTAIS